MKGTPADCASMRANQHPESEESLRHVLELGWNDLDADRIQDFDPESIERRDEPGLHAAVIVMTEDIVIDEVLPDINRRHSTQS